MVSQHEHNNNIRRNSLRKVNLLSCSNPSELPTKIMRIDLTKSQTFLSAKDNKRQSFRQIGAHVVKSIKNGKIFLFFKLPSMGIKQNKKLSTSARDATNWHRKRYFILCVVSNL